VTWMLDLIGFALGMVIALQVIVLRAVRERDRRELRDRRIRELESGLGMAAREPDLTGLPPFWRTLVMVSRELRR
jgi:hypothetical protein